MLYSFLLTLGAGLATGIGSAIAFFANHTNRKFLSFSLGVSAGVMIYVSFVEILHGAQISLEEILGVRGGMSVCALAFFGGMLLSALIDRVVPSAENPHEFKSVENMDAPAPPRHRMMRTGLLTALVVGIHNFPEGIATFMASVDSTEIGLAIAAAIAIHNIPEGIAVSVPVYYATGSRKKAFWYSFLSGISEPVGALAAYLVLIVSAHTSLCIDPIMTFGTEEQKKKYVVPLAKGEKLGAFGLTEPGAGTDAQGYPRRTHGRKPVGLAE